MPPSDVSFTANSAERWLSPRTAASRERSRYLAFLAVVLVYALLAALLAFDNKFEPVVPATPPEIPIEIVSEPPPPEKKPEPPPPAPTPPPTEQPLDEKPAFDAPRPANDEKVDRDAPDEVTKAPAEPPPVKPPGQEAETGKTTGPAPEAETPAKETPAEPDKDKSLAEPAPNGEVKQTAPEPPPPKPEPELPPEKPAASAGSPIPTFESVPDVEFAGASPRAPVAGGNAKATYFSILFGMIVPRVHRPPGARLKLGKAMGAVIFEVDGRGNLAQRWIQQSCGWSEFDNAAFEAVARASPFPPPPRRTPITVTFSYNCG